MKRLLDALWLIVLAAFVFAIPPTFHGDEAMQIYMSGDFVTAFVDGHPSALETQPPYPPDSDQQLRLINGSINRYAIGLSWRIAGYTRDDLPPHPGWDWGLDYDTNVSTGHLPTGAQLAAARLPSTVFLALSVVVMFALGWQFGGRRGAYFISGLYALNPIVLLNGRRAMQEGSMLFFGTLAILIAALISQQIQSNRRGMARHAPTKTYSKLFAQESPTPDPLAFSPNALVKQASSLPSLNSGRDRGWGLLWLSLILAGGLTLTSKHSGIVFVAGALGWIFTAALIRRDWRDLAATTLKLALSALLILSLWVALSPALWNDPLARLGDLLATRAELLDIQVQVSPDAPLSLAQRVEGIIAQPFLTPLQHYEVAFWGSFPAITSDIERYTASPFSGIQFGAILGGALTLLAGIGVIAALRRSLAQPGLYAGLLIWLLVIVVSLLANPLDWQRYYLPLIPAATLLVLLGLRALISFTRRFVLKSEQALPLSPTPPQTD